MTSPHVPSSDSPNLLGFTPGSLCFRVALIAVILMVSVGLAALMMVFRPKAKVHLAEEQVREVRVCEVRKASHPATYTGYGTVRPVREVALAAEVRGRIVRLRPGLKDGVLVAADEELLQIESADYESAHDQAAADKRMMEAILVRLERRQTDDMERLSVLEQDAALVERNLARVRDLAAKEASSATLVEQAEQAFLQRRNTLISLRSQVAQYPNERLEIQARRDQAAARVQAAALDVARCRVRAPFAGRVGGLVVEADQYVNVGQALLRLSDDRNLEIPVSVDATDALRLGLTGGKGEHVNWFEGVEKIQAQVAWSDAPGPSLRPAKVLRVDRFDADTRTVVLVVAPQPGTASAESPLVAGMFCRVQLAGREIPGSALLPRSAIQLGGRFYRVENGRIRALALNVVQRREDSFLVAGDGLSDGDLIVAEKLPFGILEGTQVRPVAAVSGGDAGSTEAVGF
jgi:multidrug efflux pump subunit AcrA (membrane-fusion protein)